MKRIFSIPLAHFFAGLFWLALAVLVFLGIASLPDAEGGAVGPASFPRILGISLLFLVVLYWVQSRKEEKVEFFEGGAGALGKIGLVLFLSYGTAYLWEKAGALPMLLVLCLVELRWVEGYGWKKTVPVGLTLAFGIWLVFTRFLGVSLPHGVLILLY
jgi:hypothetical protein